MSSTYAFTAEKRDRAGKGVARSLRRENKVPAVIYGDNKEPLRIALSSNLINVEYLKGHMFTSLCDLEVEGAKHLVLARDIQLDPVTDVVIHADFMRVTPKTKITVRVPVRFTNHEASPSLKMGGTLNVVRHDIECVCIATDIPEEIVVDLAGKEHGDSVHINDVALPKGVKPVMERNFTVATLSAPKVASADDAADAALAAAASAASAAAAAPAGGAAKAAPKAAPKAAAPKK